jgi:Tfp pilus assembly protein PilX
VSGGKRMRPAQSHGQQGFTLIVGLIMLLLLTLAAVSAFHLGSDQTIMVANAQHQNEALDAAQQAIDTAINSGTFSSNPAAAIATSNCSGGGVNTLCVDSDGDGVSDFTVSLTPAPACVTVSPIMNNSLQITSANSGDEGCLNPIMGNPGVVNSGVNGASACANSVWEVSAQSVDNATNATATVVQGVGTRIATATMAQACP